MVKLSLILLIICSGISATAQIENIPLVTVESEAVIYAKPDYAILALKIQRQFNKDDRIAPLEIFSSEDTKLHLFAFNENDIEVSYIQMENSIYIKEIYITVNDLTKLDKILLELRKRGLTNYHFFEYRIKDIKSYKDKATLQAIVLAKHKATFMATGLNQSIGKAHTIEEINSPNYNWYALNKTNIGDLTFKSGTENYLIKPGYITIVSRIKVGFDLLK